MWGTDILTRNRGNQSSVLKFWSDLLEQSAQLSLWTGREEKGVGNNGISWQFGGEAAGLGGQLATGSWLLALMDNHLETEQNPV